MENESVRPHSYFRESGSIEYGDDAHTVDLDELLPEIDELALASHSAIANTLRVKGFLGHRDSALRSAAGSNLSAVLSAAASVEVSEAAGPTNRLFAIGRRTEESLARGRSRPESFGRRHPLVRRQWTYVGLVLTGVGVFGIVSGHWWLGCAAIASRVLVSALLGRDGGFPFETGYLYEEPPVRVFVRCMLGHLTDVAALMSVAWVLIVSGREIWAMTVMGSIVLMLLATMFRIAALQVGVQLYRLSLERVVRNGALITGLFLAALLQPAVPSEGLPFVALTCLGALIYAMGEIGRTAMQIHHQSQVNGGKVPEVLILVTGSNRKAVAIRPGWKEYGKGA